MTRATTSIVLVMTTMVSACTGDELLDTADDSSGAVKHFFAGSEQESQAQLDVPAVVGFRRDAAEAGTGRIRKPRTAAR
jgi:hypothetical protein